MAGYRIVFARESDCKPWDAYVRTHPFASLYHLFGWREVIHETYGHATYYLMLVSRDGAESESRSAMRIVGVLPLVHLKSIVFGNDLVSLPFVDSGGILADSKDGEQTLLAEAIRLGQELGVKSIDLRHAQPLASCQEARTISCKEVRAPFRLTTNTSKVRMLLDLPESADMLMQSFKSKLRSQITKPLREGLISKSGGFELIADFYSVFLVNMRHLGSPVHSATLMQNVLRVFAGHSRVFVVYKGDEPVASALAVGFNGVLGNPWASSLRKYATLSPNMLLYLRMLEFACSNGYRIFDFGRSTPGEGTYRFKEQWGAVPTPLNWYRISLDGQRRDGAGAAAGSFEMASRCWRKLPLIVTRVLGPRIRKHISL